MQVAKKKNILLVEDDQDIRDSIVELLESEGYSVTATVNGQDALDYMRTTPDLPDLILLDMMMPVKDGFQFRLEQKQDERLNRVPVVVMSADGSVSAKIQDLAVAGYLKKPLDIEVILSEVSSHVS